VTGAIEITPVQLAICLVFVVITALGSLAYKLKLEKDLAIGTVRTFAQLFAVGYVLKYVFALNSVWVVLGVFAFMVFWAAETIRGRVKEPKLKILGSVYASMLLSNLVVTFIVTAVVIQVRPWYEPRYFIPLAGMIVGNAMNAVAVSLERMFSSIRKQRQEVELHLCLGGTYQEATADILRDAMRAGMIPSINGMMTVGLVSLPGMMTGQMLAGQAPEHAVRYQIVVMLMITACTAVASFIVVRLVRRRCFSPAHQIVL
jgi:putative ABC transport system permease protein